jgi:hypothetical protein
MKCFGITADTHELIALGEFDTLYLATQSVRARDERFVGIVGSIQLMQWKSVIRKTVKGSWFGVNSFHGVLDVIGPPGATFEEINQQILNSFRWCNQISIVVSPDNAIKWLAQDESVKHQSWSKHE